MATRPHTALPHIPSGRWTIVGAAFLLGLLLFAMVWLAGRRDQAVPAGPTQLVAAPEAFEPRPRPMAAGDAATPLPAPEGEEAPRLVEEAPPPPAPAPPPVESAPLPPNIEHAATAGGPATQAPAPLADQSPSPRYPPEAMRRGDAGTVVLLVAVDPEGRPVSIDVTRRSGSRELDRAAVEAVSRWRFEPARDAAGNPVAGNLSVPIDFKLR
ncbi:energy transducer TonB [Pseudoxanthomonas koreensis]|uniref:energy transducer TonB n=1 Tax=Pseudoxanthomonas koreensis TaxID=266061 RepID=UPI00139199F0|nr:energy transducer TonB [Pseudoxanthomonas koreensis]KAF1697725.1 energy transducer TonB [Pseudoxanthomonas koreensis]